MTDTKIILKTAYTNFDIFLSKYIGQNINCLVIGANTGYYSSWLLNNICTNPFSRVFSLDKWLNSDIESKFDTTINLTNKIDNHVKLNMNITKGLVRLENIKYIIFDIIIINTIEEDKDLISNTIIAWNLLNQNGIMIFDKYRDSYVEEEFKPKISIQTFVSMYREQLIKKDSAYQYIIEKKNNLNTNIDDFILSKINNYQFYKFKINFNNSIDKTYKYTPIKIPEDQQLYKLIININKSIKKYNIIKLNSEYSNNLNKNVLLNTDIKLFNNPLDMDLSIIIINSNFIYIIKKYNNIHIFINDSYLNSTNMTQILNYVNNKNIYNISFNNILISKSNYNTLIDTNKKYDILYFGLKNDNNEINYNYIYELGIALNIQEINGSLILTLPYSLSINLIIEYICLLKKYYKNVIIRNKTDILIGLYYCIICENFIGIISNELSELNLFIENILINNNDFNSIIDLYNKNNKLYKLVNDKILYYINMFLKNIINNIYTHKYINESTQYLLNNKIIYLNILNIYKLGI